ncbi:MAG: flagellar biosynthetic protein FliR, partial [Chloroflexota bacterium]
MINPLTQAPVFWEAFFLIVCRVGTILMIAPIFGNRGVPVQVKIAFTLLLSLILLPIATANLTALPESVPAFLLLV